MDCSTDFVRMIPMSRPFQVPHTILTPTIQDILQVSTFLCCTEQLAQGPCGRWMYYANKILWTPTRVPGRFVVSGCPTRVRPGLPSAVRRFSGDLGAVAGLGDGAEGCPLLRGAQDADRVAGFERQLSTWVRDHLVSPNDGQDGCPGLAPHAEVSYGVSEKVAPSVTLGLLFPGNLYLGQPYPLYLDPLRWGRTARAVRRQRSYGPLLPRPRSARGPGAPIPGRPPAPAAPPRRPRGGRDLPAARRSQPGPGDRLQGPGPAPVRRRVLPQGRQGWSARRGAPLRSRRPPEREWPRRRRTRWGSPPPSTRRRGSDLPPLRRMAFRVYLVAWRRRSRPDRTRRRRRGPEALLPAG